VQVTGTVLYWCVLCSSVHSSPQKRRKWYTTFQGNTHVKDETAGDHERLESDNTILGEPSHDITTSSFLCICWECFIVVVMWCCEHTGSYDYFMQKEIFEQPESVVNTMRGRVNFITETGVCCVLCVCVCMCVCSMLDAWLYTQLLLLFLWARNFTRIAPMWPDLREPGTIVHF